jgi:hypothetical protein
MVERSFTDPLIVRQLQADLQQTVKPPKWEKYDLTLIMFGAILGCVVTLLFTIAVIVGISIGGL